MASSIEIVGPAAVVWLMQPYGCHPEGVNPTTFVAERTVVPEGLVANIEHIPEWVSAFVTEQRIMTPVIVNGEPGTVTSAERFNVKCHAIHRDTDDFNAAIGHKRVEVAMHPNHHGKLWVTISPSDAP